MASARHLLPGRLERGAVLIAVMCGLLLFTGVGVFGGQLAAKIKQQSRNEVTESLSRAKEALLSYAVSYADNYGHNTRGGVGRLPCPSPVPNGQPAMSCGANSIGFLPSVWNRGGKRIDIDHREYFVDQNLWYAVSADFRYNPSYNHLNPDSHGQFLSVNQQNEVVAVVMHPGAAMSGQSRNNGAFLPAQYLEGENADGDSHFEIGQLSNDQLVLISRTELMPLIERRVLGIVKDWLVEYFETYGHYPFAARLGDPLAACEQGLTVGIVSMTPGNCLSPPLGDLVSAYVPKQRSIVKTWFGNYNWAPFIYYQVDSSCVTGSSTQCMGQSVNNLSLTVDGDPARFLLISTGRAIASSHLKQMQDRTNLPADLSSYLDTTELVNAGSVFDFSHLKSILASNDQYLVVR